MKQGNKYGDASYHQKLIRFNATDKYRVEMEFVKEMIDAKPGQTILDYGSGLGHMLCYLQEEAGANVFGFDVQEWWKEDERPNWFKDNLWFKIDTIYFMHSFAHIPDIENVLINFRDNILNHGGKIIVFTPNKLWLDAINNPNYTPDPTVVKHYSPDELREVFESVGFKIESLIGQGLITEDGESINQERVCLIATYHEQAR